VDFEPRWTTATQNACFLGVEHIGVQSEGTSLSEVLSRPQWYQPHDILKLLMSPLDPVRYQDLFDRLCRCLAGIGMVPTYRSR
jgi:hypothetical protein